MDVNRFRGSCWGCGKTGHRAHQCPDRRQGMKLKWVVADDETDRVDENTQDFV